MRLIRWQSALLIASFGAMSLFIAACVSGVVSQHTFLSDTYPSRPASSSVDIFTNGIPDKPFDRVAILDVQCESQAFVTPTIQDAIPALTKEARAAGCDAVIEIQEAKTPANWTFETRVKHYTGIGIVYK